MDITHMLTICGVKLAQLYLVVLPTYGGIYVNSSICCCQIYPEVSIIDHEERIVAYCSGSHRQLDRTGYGQVVAKAAKSYA